MRHANVVLPGAIVMNAAVERLLLPKIAPARVTTAYRADLHRSLWITIAAAPQGMQANFTPELLGELADIQDILIERGHAWPAASAARLDPVDYVVLRSAQPGYFSLGGDLAHFRDCIRRRDAESLRTYSIRCIDMIYRWSTHLNTRSTTITLVQGRALGGGFETALASDYLVAEEQSEFGFPEIVFGLFPCTGAMSLLARRVGVYQAERMMSDGKMYSAEELHALGIVDVVAAKGEGTACVERFVAAHAKQRSARQALLRARTRMSAIRYEELRTVVDEWVDAALCLSADNLRVMDMLIKLQSSAARI